MLFERCSAFHFDTSRKTAIKIYNFYRNLSFWVQQNLLLKFSVQNLGSSHQYKPLEQSKHYHNYEVNKAFTASRW